MDSIIKQIRLETKSHNNTIDKSNKCDCRSNNSLTIFGSYCHCIDNINISYKLLESCRNKNFELWLKLDETEDINAVQLQYLANETTTIKDIKNKNCKIIHKYINSIKFTKSEIFYLIKFFQYQLQRDNSKFLIEKSENKSSIWLKEFNNIKFQLQEKYPQFKQKIEIILNNSMNDPFHSNLYLEGLDFIEETIIIPLHKI